MKVAIVTPSYNQGVFLEKTIQSVLNQRFQDLEYIIIDGGSEDKSIDIIKRYEDRLAYWITEQDKGQSHAIHKGFQKAKGDIFCWLNSDDILFPHALIQIVGIFKTHIDVDIVTGNVVYIDENDRIIRCIRVPRMRWVFYQRNVGYFCAPAVFFKRELYEKVGGLDIELHYSMDVDLRHKFRVARAKVYHINDYLGAFRVHSSSKTGPRIKSVKKYFEHPETTLVRERYIPNVSKDIVRLFRFIYKMWQVINFNYFKGWLDLKRWKGKTWWEVFK